jgi:hypothetical protein
MAQRKMHCKTFIVTPSSRHGGKARSAIVRAIVASAACHMLYEKTIVGAPLSFKEAGRFDPSEDYWECIEFPRYQLNNADLIPLEGMKRTLFKALER